MMITLECGKLVPANCAECDRKSICKGECAYSCTGCKNVVLPSCK